MTGHRELDPDFRQKVLERSKERIPFWDLLGIDLLDIKLGWAKLRLPYTDKLSNAGGIAHGGAVFSVADSAVGTALTSMKERGESISTIEMKINYVKAFSGGAIEVEAWILHKGRNTALGEAEVVDDEGSRVAKAVATYAVIRRDGSAQ